jgi:Spy/CpxP family protein refolding chaperone
MSNKSKSYFIIFASFTLGIVAGFFLHSLFIESETDQFRRIRAEGGIVNRMENILKLNEEQKEKLRPLLEEHEKKIMNVAEKSRVEIKKIMDSFKTELKPYLTEEQIKHLTEEFNFRVPFPGPVERTKLLKEKLNLTEKQLKAIEEIYSEEEAEMKALLPKTPNIDDMKPHEKIRTIMDKIDDRILKVLNYEQKKEYKKLIEERGKGFGFIIKGPPPGDSPKFNIMFP